MTTLLFKKTTDSDLEINQKVAYKDKAGEYTLIAKIDNISTDKYGIFLYQIGGIYYMADELKLIDEDTKLCNTCDELKAEVLRLGEFVPVTYELFEYSLCVLPPIWLKNGCFQVDEEFSNGLFWTFGKKNDKYYGCLCNKNYAINNF